MSSREPGSVLDDKYEIVKRLGSGGMGEVYLVRHVHLQELRVVKILRQDLAADPVAQKRFVREARLATQIKHPNVAILYDFSRLPDGSFYMVWEHIEGQDVGDWLRRRGPFPVAVAIRLGIQALRGLGAIHAAGIIHRDLSPDNLMIMENNRQQAWLKIIDLGLAKNLATNEEGSLEITQVGMFMGKLQYCSPEQAGAATGELLDRRSDLYSFALVFYEMITGLPPFESETPHGFIFKRLSEDPLPMAGRNPKVAVPLELDRVVRQALERDPERRIPDAVSFIVALEKVEKGLSKVETREVVMGPDMRAGRPALLGAAPPDAASGASRPGSGALAVAGATAARQRSASELSKAEKVDLLAQIERAAKRVNESSVDLARAEGAIAAGRLDEARQLVAQIEAASPRAAGLDRLRERLGLAQAAAARGQAPPPVAARISSPPAAAPPLAPIAPSAAGGSPPGASAGVHHAVLMPAPTGLTPSPPVPLRPPQPLQPPPAPAAPSPEWQPTVPLGAQPQASPAASQAASAGTSQPAAPPAPSLVAPPAVAAVSAVPPAATADPRARIVEAEEVLTRYLKRKQLPLARLALETLLELSPAHPNRDDYERLVNLLAEEVEQDHRADVALEAGRAALTRRDFAGARRELEVVARNDLAGRRADVLAQELEEAEKTLRQSVEFEEWKKRLTEHLAARRLVEAESDIAHLAALGLSKFTLDTYRERLQEARSAAANEQLLVPIEKRYRETLAARDWFAARDAAAEMERAAPASPRAAAMYGEVERLETIHRRQESVEQGVRQVDAFLEKGDLPNAELAFRILLNMDPENRHRKRIERQLRAAGRG